MRRAARRGAIVLAILTTAGCAGRGAPAAAPPQPVATAPQDGAARQRMVAAETLCQQIAADPAFAPLRGRVLPRDPKVPWTRDMMTIASFVTERDRALLVVLDTKRAGCRRALITASPGQAVPFMEYWRRQDDALVKLYNREIPIGIYNQTMADAQTQFSVEVSNQRTDRAVRANEGLSQGDAPTARDDTGPPLDSLRALGSR
jgi:hypothetical protein